MLVLLASPHRAVSRSSSPCLYHRALLAIRAFTRTSMAFSVRKISGGGGVVCCVREREQKERAKVGVARGGWAGVRRERKRAEIECLTHVLENGLRKKKKICKPFSHFFLKDFPFKDKQFTLTFILQRNKHLQMMKTFYEKCFTSKQTEPKGDMSKKTCIKNVLF